MGALLKKGQKDLSMSNGIAHMWKLGKTPPEKTPPERMALSWMPMAIKHHLQEANMVGKVFFGCRYVGVDILLVDILCEHVRMHACDWTNTKMALV